MKNRKRVVPAVGWILSLAGLAFFLGEPRLAWADVKLYLKDGSFQVVKSYAVHGDRVRYYSVDRSAWEEIPKSLVDFAATEKYRKEEDATQKQELEEVLELEKQRFEKPEETGYEVAPGVRLPKGDGVFAYDGVRAIPMIPTPAEIVRDKKRAALLLALPAPVLRNRVLVVLPGARAAIRIPVNQPTFYIQLSDAAANNLELLAVKPGKDSRVVEKILTGIGAGKSGESRSALPVERKQIMPGLFKVRPVQPLTPGEYALGELIQEKLNLELWDFGIEGIAKVPRTGKAARSGAMSEQPPERFREGTRR